MSWRILRRWGVVVAIVALAGWPTAGAAQTATGHARAVQTTILGSRTVLSDTGTLSGSDDALQASQVTGAVPSVLTAEALHATTIGWPDQTAAEASLAALRLTVAGTGISAGFVMARAAAILGDRKSTRLNS